MLENGKYSVFDRQIEKFEQQRVEFNARIDKMQTENNDKDKHLAELKSVN